MSKEIEEAKKVLEEAGYFTDSLWQVVDVQSKFECTEDEAMEVLQDAFENDATYSQIWVSIDYAKHKYNLKPKKD
jgi:hypothetical protein